MGLKGVGEEGVVNCAVEVPSKFWLGALVFGGMFPAQGLIISSPYLLGLELV